VSSSKLSPVVVVVTCLIMHQFSVDILYKARDDSRALARAILDKAPWLWRLKIDRVVVGLALQDRDWHLKYQRLLKARALSDSKHVAFQRLGRHLKGSLNSLIQSTAFAAFALKRPEALRVSDRVVRGDVRFTGFGCGTSVGGFQRGDLGGKGGGESRFTSEATLACVNHLLVVRDVVRGESVNLVHGLEGVQVAFPAFQAGSTRLFVALLVFVVQGPARLVGLASKSWLRHVAEVALGVADFAERHCSLIR